MKLLDKLFPRLGHVPEQSFPEPVEIAAHRDAREKLDREIERRLTWLESQNDIAVAFSRASVKKEHRP